jgi:nucleoside-diphosphate-sugar epimerase
MSGGGSVRSYLYATDLCSQLWALLVRGTNATAYNVGSNIEVTIRELANAIVENINKSASVVVRGTDNSMNVTRYVPSVEKMEQETEKSQTVFLNEALKRTSEWIRETGI